MKTVSKNIKISQKHHEILKAYCDKNGMKIYRVVEKWIDDLSKIKKKDIYGET
jgi:hypothetical protein